MFKMERLWKLRELLSMVDVWTGLLWPISRGKKSSFLLVFYVFLLQVLIFICAVLYCPSTRFGWVGWGANLAFRPFGSLVLARLSGKVMGRLHASALCKISTCILSDP